MDPYTMPLEQVTAIARERGIDVEKYRDPRTGAILEHTVRRMVATRLKREARR